MSNENDPPAKLPFQINFGLLIAFFLPGAISIYALGYLSPTIASLVKSLESGDRISGPVMLLSVFSLVAGLIVDAFRGIVLEQILNKSVKKSNLDFKEFTDPNKLRVFNGVVENYYRYFQFKGNTLIAMILLVGARLLFGTATICGSPQDIVLNISSVAAIVILFFGAKDSFASMHEGINSLNMGGK